jgi:L-ascorbate metabolism protein UlaG (beta-lactamase superfamily)
MSDRNYYLRQNVQIEPLFSRWYSWPYVIAPAQASMNVANSHLKIMKAYVNSPQIHAAAVKNPAMRGGPFIDYDGKRVDEIEALMNKTIKEQAQMLEFADGVKALNQVLSDEAKGYSLEPLYEKVPRALKGYVELVYDLNDHASIRFLERLLYKSPYYQPSLQSLSLSLVKSDERAFAFSTPRLGDAEHLHLAMPFGDERVDKLMEMRERPRTFPSIKETLELDDKDDELFMSFLTEQAPEAAPRYDGEQVRIRYFGHACNLIETKDVCIITDPIISYNYASAVPRYTYADLPETIDYVLLTHVHADHTLFESLLQLRYKIKKIVVPRSGGGALEDPSLKLVLENIGFKNVVEIDEMETIEIEGGSITALPFFGEHADLNIRTKAAHMVRLAGKTIVCAADSANIEHRLYEHIHDLVGDIDVLFIGMECDGAPLTWVYGPLITKHVERKMDRSRTLSGSDYARAIAIVNQLNCKQVYVYAMGQEPWLSFVTSIHYTDESIQIIESNKLIAACQQRGLTSERLYLKKEILL